MSDAAGTSSSQLDAAVRQAGETGLLSLTQASLETVPPPVLHLGSRLTLLNLSRNQLQDLPASLAVDLPALETLVLAWNRFALFPPPVADLRRLRVLDLSFNKLETLPEAVARLGNLEELLVSDNELEALPDGIARLGKLKSLNLRYNEVRALPNVMCTMENLRDVNLNGNPVESPPMDVVYEGVAAIREYLALKHQGKRVPKKRVTSRTAIAGPSRSPGLNLELKELRTSADSLRQLIREARLISPESKSRRERPNSGRRERPVSGRRESPVGRATSAPDVLSMAPSSNKYYAPPPATGGMRVSTNKYFAPGEADTGAAMSPPAKSPTTPRPPTSPMRSKFYSPRDETRPPTSPGRVSGKPGAMSPTRNKYVAPNDDGPLPDPGQRALKRQSPRRVADNKFFAPTPADGGDVGPPPARTGGKYYAVEPSDGPDADGPVKPTSITERAAQLRAPPRAHQKHFAPTEDAADAQLRNIPGPRSVAEMYWSPAVAAGEEPRAPEDGRQYLDARAVDDLPERPLKSNASGIARQVVEPTVFEPSYAPTQQRTVTNKYFSRDEEDNSPAAIAARKRAQQAAARPATYQRRGGDAGGAGPSRTTRPFGIRQTTSSPGLLGPSAVELESDDSDEDIDFARDMSIVHEMLRNRGRVPAGRRPEWSRSGPSRTASGTDLAPRLEEFVSEEARRRKRVLQKRRGGRRGAPADIDADLEEERRGGGLRVAKSAAASGSRPAVVGAGDGEELPPRPTTPKHFICPITQHTMEYPVVAADGHTYEEESIRKWLRTNQKSPMTGLAMKNDEVTPNFLLRSMIADFHASRQEWDAKAAARATAARSKGKERIY